MKNIFRLMGLALIAGSLLFTACKKDDENTNNNNNNNNNTPSIAEGTAKVTFGSETFTVSEGLMYTGKAESNNAVMIRMFKESGKLPYVDLTCTTKLGNYTASMGIEDSGQGYTQPTGTNSTEIYSIEVAKDKQLQDGNGNVYGDWMILNGSLNLTALDVNALTASFTLTATMFDFASWSAATVNNVEDADTRKLSVEANAYQFANWQ